MTTEQEGAPSATADGASAPDVAAPIEEVPPHPAYVENAVAGALTDMYGFLPLSVRYGAAAAARAAVESWQRMTGPAAVPDPRDAEIDRLHVVIGRQVEKIRSLQLEIASARSIADGKRTVAEKLRGQVDELEAQRDRRQSLWQIRYGQLIGGALDAQQHLQRALGKPALPSDMFDPDYSRSVVDELKAELDGERQLRAEIASERDNARQERNRLRQELDLVGEKHATGLVTLRTDFTAAVNGLLPKPAEPRRWTVGDPEPEIGTTVRPANSKLYGGPYTRRHNGWHTDFECPPDCEKAGGSWSWVTSHTGGLVEVVNSNG